MARDLQRNLTESQKLAIIFHDYICTPGNADNEVLSARAMAARCQDMLTAGDPGPRDTVLEAYEIILSTKAHKPICRAAELVIDLDLWDLGTDRYASNARLIAQEYMDAGITAEDYMRGRREWLAAMLARPRIYCDLPADHEARARENLKTELNALKSRRKLRRKPGRQLRRQLRRQPGDSRASALTPD